MEKGLSMAAPWTPLPRGAFSGIDWGTPGAADGFDPYLVWAEASRFAGYHLHETPQWLPVIVELAAGLSIREFVQAGSPDWLRVSAVYLDNAPTGLRFCTASIAPGFFAALAPGGSLHGKVQRFELGLPVGDHAKSTTPAPAAQGTASPAARLTGTVFGLIDGGLAFANRDFLRSDGTVRTQYFWRQDQEGNGKTPPELGYGHELRAADIAEAMHKHTYHGLVDEEAVYREFGLADLRKPVNHGTHVAGLACAPRKLLATIANLPPDYDAPPTWALANDEASRCDIVAVQLDWSNVVDTSGGSMNVSIMDGLMYILSRCDVSARVVVNVSWGTLAGPHNGSSLLEAAMDELVRLRPGLDIVLPAGNGYQDRLHANATLAPGQCMLLHWNAQADDATQSFLELWLPTGANGVSVQLRPPGGAAASPAVPLSEASMWANAAGEPLAALIFPSTVATGTGSTCALIALAPSFAFGEKTVTAPCGRWEVEISNGGSAAVTIDAYIERDDVPLGQNTGARQSYFDDTLYDTTGNPDAYVDKPVPLGRELDATLIRRSGTFNSIGTGRETVSVGGLRIAGQDWSTQALYSPRDPDPDASRPERPGVVKVPDRMAYGDENPVLLGLRSSGTLSGSVARLVGTSGSAPLVTRELLSMNSMREDGRKPTAPRGPGEVTQPA
jgi:hypothetical protein